MTTKARNIKADNLMGATEVAAYLGVSRQRVLELRQKNEKFPDPAAKLKSGPVWDKAAIDIFVDQWDRKPGRPRKDGSVAPEAVESPTEVPHPDEVLEERSELFADFPEELPVSEEEEHSIPAQADGELVSVEIPSQQPLHEDNV
jgi:predicted DNA-binding transcriptional regulator AlpA